MKKLFVLLMAIGLLSGGAIAQSTKKTASTPPKQVLAPSTNLLGTEADSISYAIGVSMAKSLKNLNIPNVKPEVISAAIADVLAGKNVVISEKDAMMIVQNYLMNRQVKEQKKNLQEGEMFLANNAKEVGVVTLPSGLQYKIINAGDVNNKPAATDKVVAHYTGKLLNGKVFDSSRERGEPITFGLDQVIKGWTEGLQLIGKGGHIILYIPSALAYGERGAGPQIPGNSTLIFDIELIDVVK